MTDIWLQQENIVVMSISFRQDEGEEDTAPVKTEATDEEPSDEEDEPAPAPQPAPPASATENVAKLLRQLQSSGALVRRPAAPVSPPKVDHRCVTCCLRFPDWGRLERHLIEHVSLPWVALERLPDDDETPPSSDDEGGSPALPAPTPAQDIARRLSNSGISIKKPSPANVTTNATATAALDKLSGLGFTIKKTTPVKEEKPDLPVAANSTPDILQKLGKLGGIKLKLKSEGSDTNSFKVVNGLKDFKTSDDEDSERDDEPRPSDEDDEPDADERPAAADATRLPVPALVRANVSAPPRPSSLKVEPIKIASGIQAAIRPARPVIKQTPKRVPGSESIRPPAPVSAQSLSAVSVSATEGSRSKILSPPTQSKEITTSSSPNRATTATQLMDNVVVKKEVDDDVQSGNVPLFAGQIKTERASPPVEEPAQAADPTPASAPASVTVKTEADTAGYGDAGQPLFSNDRTPTHSAAFASAPTPPLRQTPSQPLPPVTKTEESGVTIIEINGDSNDEDDDCCVVSATPAPDVKPLMPKIETPAYSSSVTSAYTSSSVATGNILATQLSGGGDARSDYYWNTSESKPPIDALQKSADELFESLLASTTKKENLSLADASEYISLDRLGSQHSCDVCNTRFTDVSLLDEHIRITGHCKSIVTPGSVSSAVLPYGASSNAIMSSLLPVKQLAEQVGKLSGSGGFTHQQNVMINIQAYPGAGGMMVPPQTYNPYGAGQPMGPGGPYQNPATGMYQPYPGQQPYGQPYQTPMSKAGFNATAPGMYATAPGTHAPPYSTASSGIQQSAYGQPTGHMNPPQSPLGMGPPNAAPGQVPSPQYPPHSSPGLMKPPTSSSGIRIQNVQTFAPGQGPIVSASGQVNTPTPVRMAGPTLGPVRPRVSAPPRSTYREAWRPYAGPNDPRRKSHRTAYASQKNATSGRGRRARRRNCQETIRYVAAGPT
ncbi:hypothetical protein EVAR_93795_1 [Eumeta japonica]|uniref:C2H2-type domain-containing protein n=1 Tax=Eumeta variegata TaxID=151549 RepID=A0A4C1VCT2_EUMVA|nr:hypothetical protein EVAR_93795_1 [Eumeta japonica]